jgi:hypothetical protein
MVLQPPPRMPAPSPTAQLDAWMAQQQKNDVPFAQAEAAYHAALRFQAQRQYQQDLASGMAPSEALAKWAPLMFSTPKPQSLSGVASLIRATTPPAMTPYQADEMKFRREQAANKTVNIGPSVDRIHKLEQQLDTMAEEQAGDRVKNGQASSEEQAKKLPPFGPLADEKRAQLIALRNEVNKAQGRSTMGPATTATRTQASPVATPKIAPPIPRGRGTVLPMESKEPGARVLGMGEPLVQIPRLEASNPAFQAFLTGATGQLPSKRFAETTAAAANVAKGLPEFMTSPLGVATAPIAAAGGLPARLLGLGFAGQMAAGVPESAREAGRLSIEGTGQEAKEALLGLGANIVLPATLAAWALSRKPVAKTVEEPPVEAPKSPEPPGTPLPAAAVEFNEAQKAAEPTPLPPEAQAAEQARLAAELGQEETPKAATTPTLDLKSASEASPAEFFKQSKAVTDAALAKKGPSLQVTAENAFRANPDVAAWEKAYADAQKDASEAMATMRKAIDKAIAEGKPTDQVMIDGQDAMVGAAQKAQFFSEGLKIAKAEAKPTPPAVEDVAKSTNVPQNVPQNIQDLINDIETMPVREREAIIGQILPEVSRETHEGVADLSPVERSAAKEDELSKLRTQLSSSREAYDSAVRIVRGSGRGGAAPPGLQQAVAGDVPVPKVPPEAAQTGSVVAPNMGPGAAAAADQPAAPRQALAAAAPVETGAARPLGLISAASHGLNTFLNELRVIGRGIAGQTMPRTTASNRPAGEAGARYLASSLAALPEARKFSTATLEGTGVDPVKFGAALVEDNLNSIRESFRAQVTELMSEGKQDEADAARAAADNVGTLIGSPKAPFKTQDEYFDYLKQPEVQRAISQHIQQWKDVVEPMYREAQSLDPDVELPTRGQQTGARVNLKVLFPDEETTPTSRGVGASSLTKTFKRKSPFAIKAKGSGERYEVNYHDIIANTFQRQLEIANKNAFDRTLIQTGNAIAAPPGRTVEIGGKRAVPFPLQRRVLLTDGRAIPMGQNLYVRSDLAGEYRRASNVDERFRIPYLTATLNGLNKAALAGLTDFTVHTSNLMTALFNRPNSGGLLTDTLLSLTGRADVPVTLTKALIKGFKNNQGQLADLAEIAATRPEQPGFKWGTGAILRKIDATTRLVLDDTFTSLAEQGLVENTETARREYTNQVGQYNRRAQGPLTRFLRETGFGPFVTAGKTFNALGVKMATLSPGAPGANLAASAALRANVLAKWVGGAALIGTLNYLLTKGKGGGVMGRKGTPLGYIDTGTNGKDGRAQLIPAADIVGLGRALRITGVKGAIDAKRFGLTDADAVEGASRDIINAAIGPAAGPVVRFGFIAASGYPPAVKVGRASPVAAPGASQQLENIKAAAKQANPLVASYFDYKQDKPVAEILKRQLPRFSLTPGKPPELIDRYPKVVNLAQTYAYVDYLASQARSMDQSQRNKFLRDALSKVDSEHRDLMTNLLIRKKIRFSSP